MKFGTLLIKKKEKIFHTLCKLKTANWNQCMLDSLVSLTGPQCVQRTKAENLYSLVIIAERNPEHRLQLK